MNGQCLTIAPTVSSCTIVGKVLLVFDILNSKNEILNSQSKTGKYNALGIRQM